MTETGTKYINDNPDHIGGIEPEVAQALSHASEIFGALAAAISPIVEEVGRRLVELSKWCGEVLRETAKAIEPVVSSYTDLMLCATNTNPKWWHLYKHAKKARTRKKYRRLLMQQYRKAMEAKTIAKEVTK